MKAYISSYKMTKDIRKEMTKNHDTGENSTKEESIDPKQKDNKIGCPFETAHF